MIPDAVASALFELVQGGNKKQLLEELRIDYEKWCMESGFTITHLVIFVTFCISTGLQGFFTNISNRSQKLVFFKLPGFQPRSSTCCPCEQETVHFGCHYPIDHCLCPHLTEDPERCCGSDDCFLDGPHLGENRFSTRCICPRQAAWFLTSLAIQIWIDWREDNKSNEIISCCILECGNVSAYISFLRGWDF